MKEVKISIKVAFQSDACLVLYFRRAGKLYYVESWSCPTVGYDNYFNDRYTMNLIETQHNFVVNLQDDDVTDYSCSRVEFGFSGSRDRWVGPGRLKTVALSDLISK